MEDDCSDHRERRALDRCVLKMPKGRLDRPRHPSFVAARPVLSARRRGASVRLECRVCTLECIIDDSFGFVRAAGASCSRARRAGDDQEGGETGRRTYEPWHRWLPVASRPRRRGSVRIEWFEHMRHPFGVARPVYLRHLDVPMLLSEMRNDTTRPRGYHCRHMDESYVMFIRTRYARR